MVLPDADAVAAELGGMRDREQGATRKHAREDHQGQRQDHNPSSRLPRQPGFFYIGTMTSANFVILELQTNLVILIDNDIAARKNPSK